MFVGFVGDSVNDFTVSPPRKIFSSLNESADNDFLTALNFGNVANS